MTELQVQALLAEAKREEKLTRAAVVVADDALRRAAVEVADIVTKPEVLRPNLADRYLAIRAQYKQALRAWRLAKQAREVAETRRAS